MSKKPGGGGFAEQQYDFLFKILLVGESAVGKTALMGRFTDNYFDETFTSTIGVDFRLKSLNINDKLVKLQIWDTAGQERFRNITNSYFRGAHGVLIVYDVTNLSSFEKVQYWLKELRPHTSNNVCLALVGNKCDMAPQRVVSPVQGNKLASDLGLKLFETSAKTNVNVTEVFNALAHDVLAVRLASGPVGGGTGGSGGSGANERTGLKLGSNDKPTTDGGCC
ncbi:small GTP binding protein RAB8 [Pelomyxa schiedti]|nr:small GTP binding protein RAB8 [Pelomyxa schiedti]